MREETEAGNEQEKSQKRAVNCRNNCSAMAEGEEQSGPEQSGDTNS